VSWCGSRLSGVSPSPRGFVHPACCACMQPCSHMHGHGHACKGFRVVLAVLMALAGPRACAAEAAAGPAAAASPAKAKTLTPLKRPAAAAADAGAESDGDDSGSGCIICMVRQQHWAGTCLSHIEPPAHHHCSCGIAASAHTRIPMQVTMQHAYRSVLPHAASMLCSAMHNRCCLD
jgi:hypothetical protein